VSSLLGLDGRFALLSGPHGPGLTRRLHDEGMSVAELQVDGRDRARCDRALAEALGVGGGRLDLLVSTQDTRIDGSLAETSEETFRELLERDLTTPFRIARACFATMREHGGGSMIFVGSDAGIRAAHEAGAFSVTSAALIAVAELFAAEGAPHGIRANAVCPRPGTDVASLIAWLASDESAHLNGATLRVDDAAGAAMVVDTRI
jgi:NAD(P)-dependent dehydrogenase (short-subunit alcohol dehydrogenase family)